MSLLLGYASATCGAVAAGQLAGAINPGVAVCQGAHGGIGISNGVGHHYYGVTCGRADNGRCRCGGTLTTTVGSSNSNGGGSSNPRSTITVGTGRATDQSQFITEPGLVHVTSHIGTTKTKTSPTCSQLEPCYAHVCPGTGRLGSDGAAAAVDMQMGLTGISMV